MSNYYIALIDTRQPDVHMTLSYYKDLEPSEVSDLDQRLREDIKNLKPKPFELDWDFEGWFGRNNTVRVLQPRPKQRPLIPDWVMSLVDEPRQWAPHITTEEESIQMRIDRIEIRCKSNTICAYPLDKEYGRG